MTSILFLLIAAPALGAEAPVPPSPDFATGVAAPPRTLPGADPSALFPVPFDNAPPPLAATAGLPGAAGDPAAEPLVGPDQWPGIPDLLVDHLALDWGVANIGGPTLFPPGGVGTGRGSGTTPRGSGGSARQAATLGPPTTLPPPTPEAPSPVPEPGAMILWGTVVAALACRRLRGAP